jgi:hypothetical protein
MGPVPKRGKSTFSSPDLSRRVVSFNQWTDRTLYALRSVGGVMRKIKLEQLRPGMRLAQDVVNFSGQVLLYKGNPLQPKDIKNFKAWGVLEIAVESSSLNSSNSLDNNRIDTNLLVEAQNEISDLFRHSNLSHPVISELMRLSTLNKLKQKPGMENVNVY